MKVLVLGDTHFPFCDWAALQAAADFAKSYKPHRIVQVGDFLDRFNWSRFVRYPDSPSAKDEFDDTLLALERFRKMFGERVPMTILQGNHDRRLLMRAWDVNIPEQLIRPMKEIFPHKNWTFHPDQDPFMFDGVCYVHGDEGPGGKAFNKAKQMGINVVQGHLHRDAGVNYIRTFNKEFFGLDVGCLMDRGSVAARYSRKDLLQAWIGWATVTDGIPHLYPYRKKKKARKK